jgi:hypothetical protein
MVPKMVHSLAWSEMTVVKNLMNPFLFSPINIPIVFRIDFFPGSSFKGFIDTIFEKCFEFDICT